MPTLLCVMDGFGLNPRTEGNAVAQAKKPFIDRLLAHYPNTTLTTCGEEVGLPAGQMGNSEVGHLNIGAGRVVEQWLLRISRALEGTFLDTSPEYGAFLKEASTKKSVHLVGLISDGGVHSHVEHLRLLIKRLHNDLNVPLYIHVISDGRDTSPTLLASELESLNQFLEHYPRAHVVSICGRFFAMDRDKRWERVKQAYDLIRRAEGTAAVDGIAFLRDSYGRDITDEFIEPCTLTRTPLTNDDCVVFWNFRADRMREIVAALCSTDFPGFDRAEKPIAPRQVLCFTEYDPTFHLPYLFQPIEVRDHLGEVIGKIGLKQLRVAETEKYPHVTYFFNGGVEIPAPGEDRSMVPSPRDVKTYDLKPEMSAAPVTDIIVKAIEEQAYDLIVVNLANCDMVGHTGNLAAAIKAVETVDTCVGRMVKAIESVSGRALIIADHGNAEQMINYEDGSPHTAHTTFPVPAICIGCTDVKSLRAGGALCDVAPTILDMMGLSLPTEMTGRSLLVY